ncbi:type I-E CRISPR-associated protein Cas5/CasD [Streptomyces scabiei]|uniref:CRISPR system Cascade subunit CasD n=1 Tax=Streptomyces scabiei TaxID=1930 RepID=A0A100JTG0_STRSC|nr:type I-E CRISPR-associated protein Cas5/CasD [Streptomyces scabiei]GAQ65359.1 CRISPR system Cascade subunit CasD [Streptomyces scabiei]
MSTATEAGLLLRLAGPLQSWGERSHFNERDTARFPTRSGVIGLLASALGRRRGAGIDDLTGLSITIRTDRPGIILRDLHTVGGGLPAKATVTTAEGKKRPGDTGTLLTHRSYLADAAFTLALTARDDAALLDLVAEALATPHWPPYLGRRSCPPEGPLLLGRFDDVAHHLVHLPLAAPVPRAGTGAIEFLSDRPLDRLPAPSASTGPDTDTGAHPAGESNDQPLTFHTRHRAYRSRPLYRRTLHLPAAQHTGLGADHLNTLTAYLNQFEGSRP